MVADHQGIRHQGGVSGATFEPHVDHADPIWLALTQLWEPELSE